MLMSSFALFRSSMAAFRFSSDASNFGIAAVLYQEYIISLPDYEASYKKSKSGTQKVVKYIGFMARS